MLDFGCGAGSHSHFQFVTVSQTAAGQRLARTPLAGRRARDRVAFLINYSSFILAPPSYVSPPPQPTVSHLPHHHRRRHRAKTYTSGGGGGDGARRGVTLARKQVLTPGGRLGNVMDTCIIIICTHDTVLRQVHTSL